MVKILARVSEILAEHLNLDPQKITLDTTFAELEADSLDVVEIVMTLEDEYNIEIPDEQVEKIETVGQVVEAIHAQVV